MRRYNKYDTEKVAKLMVMPEVEKWTQEEPMDYKSMKRLWEKTLSGQSVFVLGRDPRKEVFLFIPLHGNTYTVHVALHPDNRGHEALQAMQDAAGVMFDKTKCQTLITFVAADHKACCAFVGMCGMKQVGRTEKTFLRNGELVDEIIYQGTEEKYRRLLCQ